MLGYDLSRRERFEKLYRATYPAVLAYLRRRAHPEVAHEALAETFLVAWRRFEDVPDDPLPWLYGVARRTLANELRGARRRDRLGQRIEQTAVTTAADHSEAVVDRFVVRQALAELGEDDRELLMLITWEGLSGADVARALGCSTAAVRVRLHRARRRLAGILHAVEARPNDPVPAEPEEAR